MAKEFDALNSNHTWDIVQLPPTKNALPYKWVYKVKLKSDEYFERSSSGYLGGGGDTQCEGIDFTKTFSPVIKMTTIRCLLFIFVKRAGNFTNSMSKICSFTGTSMKRFTYSFLLVWLLLLLFSSVSLFMDLTSISSVVCTSIFCFE